MRERYPGNDSINLMLDPKKNQNPVCQTDFFFQKQFPEKYQQNQLN